MIKNAVRIFQLIMRFSCRLLTAYCLLVCGFITSLHAGDALNEALQLKDEGRYDEAEIKLKEILEFEPSNAPAHFELANINAMQQDYYRQNRNEEMADLKLKQAAQSLKQVVMIDPAYIPGHFNLGVVYKKQGKYSEARDEFRKVRELAPDDINALMQIGMTYEDQGFHDEARVVYQEAQDLQPHNPDVRNALVLLQQNQLKSQEESMRMPLSHGLTPFQSSLNLAATQGQQPAALMQAIPYLGQMLMQQFMKGKKES
jgi:tetratricopeptide (TPR) repeat protein